MCHDVVDVARFTLQGEAVQRDEEALGCAVLSCAEGVLEVLWADAGRRRRGGVPYGLVKVSEALPPGFQVVPKMLGIGDVRASPLRGRRGRRMEGAKFCQDSGVLGVVAAL